MKKLIPFLLALIALTFNSTVNAQNNREQQNTESDSTKQMIQKAQDLLKQGNTEEASKIYVNIIGSQPDNKEAVQGWLFANMKRAPSGKEDAIKLLEELGKSYPDNSAIVFFKAFIEAEYGHNDEALASINKAFEIEPGQAVNFYNRACIYCLKGEKANSFADLRKAISVNPGFKANARKDEDFKSLYNDEDFIMLTK